MSTLFLVVATLTYSLTLWLGLYLMARAARQPGMLLAGLGLLTYALAVGADILLWSPLATTRLFLSQPLIPVQWLRTSLVLHLLPPLVWTGALLYLLPAEHGRRPLLTRVWWQGLLPITLVALIALPLEGLFVRTQAWQTPLALALMLLILAPLLFTVILVLRPYEPGQPRSVRGILLVAILFFALGTVLFLSPLGGLSPLWMYLFISPDVLALGISIAWLDAFNQGESFLPDFVRSLDAALVAALVFGGQVALAMALGVGVTTPMLTLLLATLATAIALATLADPIQEALDRFAFARSPQLSDARADLRAAASALPRLSPTVDMAALDEAEFVRLVRRALTHYGDLPRLAASPLTYLPQVDHRLVQAAGAIDDPLERAMHLKAVLAEGIARLKPRTGDDFGTTDEWRHYNALYFPYVVGLKPYSRRAATDNLDSTARAALEWFQTQIPERTLYNWQTAAARLIATDLRERQVQSMTED